jgi:DNA-binding MarR family transcriptional regulator
MASQGESSSAEAKPPDDAWLDDVRRVAAFRAALRRLERRTERAARAVGATPRQYLLLLAVVGGASGPRRMTVNELATDLQLAQSTVTGLIDRAEQAGLVRRVAAAGDARFVHVVATDRGHEVLRSAMRELEVDREQVALAAAELRAQLAAD